MAESRDTPKIELPEVMIAMDVVDTLRHQRSLVERELQSEDRERALIEKLRKIYADQGIDVCGKKVFGKPSRTSGQFRPKPGFRQPLEPSVRKPAVADNIDFGNPPIGTGPDPDFKHLLAGYSADVEIVLDARKNTPCTMPTTMMFTRARSSAISFEN